MRVRSTDAGRLERRCIPTELLSSAGNNLHVQPHGGIEGVRMHLAEWHSTTSQSTFLYVIVLLSCQNTPDITEENVRLNCPCSRDVKCVRFSAATERNDGVGVAIEIVVHSAKHICSEDM